MVGSFNYEMVASVAMVFGGCMAAIVFMELVLKGDPKSGNLLTFTAVIAVIFQWVVGRITAGGLSQKVFRTPVKSHVQFASLWVSMSVLANYAFGYSISVPIFTLIRSCNIIATVVLGFLCFGQRYSWQQLICVVIVTVGVFSASAAEWTTLNVGREQRSSGGCTDCKDAIQSSAANGEADVDVGTWAIGIAMLVIVQAIQGFLGHLQSGFYREFKSLGTTDELSDEYLFTANVVALLPFIWLREDVLAAAKSALASEPIALPFENPLQLPSRVVWLILNNISQVICLKGVFRASAALSPLSLTIVLSVRKFLSVSFSICWFGNPWTHLHSMASVLIFGGAFAYSQVPKLAAATERDKKAK
eukprot:gnl/MRDRNA2_/MRDRNA2_202934_c0_seq1.p1 gnl/MRDRNA2_/MRDRNA2_202934_c0~~gnl/MRDRNA2_/MRDRNA2_202934_c0_seq1.p1  ORF type:complete len:361 (-),score=32.53 gnl/MRDRNA2_/MRDRNA2_202934_c0_seq1:79-1161(-)